MHFFSGPVNALCFLSDEKLLVGEGFSVKLFDLATNKCIKEIRPFTQTHFKISRIDKFLEFVIVQTERQYVVYSASTF